MTRGFDWDDYRERVGRAIAAIAAADRLDPARARRVLAERAAGLARPLKTEAVLRQPAEVLTFRLQRERYAVDVPCVRQVARLLDLAPLPGAPPAFLGLTLMRGALLPVADLALVLGGERRGLSDRNLLVVLGPRLPEVALVADAVESVSTIDLAAVQPLPEAAQRPESACVRGVLTTGTIVLDAIKLLAHPRLRAHSASGHARSDARTERS